MEFYYGSSEEVSSIKHFGKKGKSGRYPWGSGERPYQRLEKRRGLFRRRKKEKEPEGVEVRPGVKMYSTRQQVQTSLNNSNLKDMSVGRDVKAKGNAIKDTRKKMEYIYEHREHYTNDEIRAVIARNQAENALMQEIAKSKPVSKSKLKKMVDTVDNVSRSATRVINMAENGIKSYNKAAKIYNGLMNEQIKSGKAKPMGVIPGFDQQKKKKDKSA